MPFKGEPAASPAPYADFSHDSYKTAPSPSAEAGVFLSAEEVDRLRQWAEERDALCERLEQMEQLADSREEELASLRAQIAASADADAPRLRARRTAGPEREALLPLAAMAAPRRSAAEANALATQRQHENLAKREAENARLREEWRQLRSSRNTAS